MLTESMEGLTRLNWQADGWNWKTTPLQNYSTAIPRQALRALNSVKEMPIPFEDFHVAENDKIVLAPEPVRQRVSIPSFEPRIDPYLLGRIGRFGVAIAFWV